MPIQASVTQFSGGVNAFYNQSAHSVADYLYWMCGRFALEAQQILNIATPGGQVSTSLPRVPVLPILVTAAEFEPDGVTYINYSLGNAPLMIFINNYSSSWFSQSSGAFINTGYGIKITLPGFNIFAGTPPFSVVIQLNNI